MQQIYNLLINTEKDGLYEFKNNNIDKLSLQGFPEKAAFENNTIENSEITIKKVEFEKDHTYRTFFENSEPDYKFNNCILNQCILNGLRPTTIEFNNSNITQTLLNYSKYEKVSFKNSALAKLIYLTQNQKENLELKDVKHAYNVVKIVPSYHMFLEISKKETLFKMLDHFIEKFTATY